MHDVYEWFDPEKGRQAQAGPEPKSRGGRSKFRFTHPVADSFYQASQRHPDPWVGQVCYAIAEAVERGLDGFDGVRRILALHDVSKVARTPPEKRGALLRHFQDWRPAQ